MNVLVKKKSVRAIMAFATVISVAFAFVGTARAKDTQGSGASKAAQEGAASPQPFGANLFLGNFRKQ